MNAGDPMRPTPGGQVSRNAPCPCGSGKKYKKCCLPKEVRRDLASIERDLEADMTRPDRFDDPTLDAWKQADRAVVRKLSDSTAETYQDPHELFDKYFPASLMANLLKLSMEERAVAEMLDWAGLDYRPKAGAKTVAERMLEQPADLTEKERQVLIGMAGAARSLWQIVRVVKDRGVEAEDLLRGGRIFLDDVSLSRSAALWSISPFRVYPAGPFHFLTGGGVAIPPEFKAIAVAFFKRRFAIYQRKRPGAGWDEFLRAKSELFPRLVDELGIFEEHPAPQMANTSGEPFLFCEAEFSAENPDVALAALDGKGRFELREHDGVREVIRFGTTPESVPMGRTVEAVLKVAGGKLVLECNSRRRLAGAKKVILSIPGVKHLKDSFRTPEDLLAEQPFQASPSFRGAVPKELDEASRHFNEQYYEEHWIRDRIPMLGGQDAPGDGQERPGTPPGRGPDPAHGVHGDSSPSAHGPIRLQPLEAGPWSGCTIVRLLPF